MSDTPDSVPPSLVRASRISLLFAIAAFVYLAVGFSTGGRSVLDGPPVWPAGTGFISFEHLPTSSELLTWDRTDYGSATFLIVQRGVGHPGWAIRIQPWVTFAYLGIAALIALSPRITYRLRGSTFAPS